MKSPETKRRHRGPGFHKNRLWQHAVVNDDNGQSLGPFGLHNLKQGPNRAMGCHRRHSFSSGHTTSLKRVRTSDASEEIVQFRRVQLPSSNSYDGSTERLAPNLPRLPTDTSIRSRSSNASQSLWYKDDGWNVAKLLELSEIIRDALSKGQKLSFEELEDLNFVLDMMLVDKLDDETPAEPPGAHVGAGVTQKITFATIQRARLDKLLVDMLRAYDKEATAVPLGGIITETGLGSEIESATSLQKHWQTRFKSEYFRIDKYRFDVLMSGSLQDVAFSAVASDGLGVWMPTEAIEISEAEGNQKFIPGHWWLNIGCAHRDGIVGAAFERATKGRYGVAALPMLTGREEDLPDGKTVYIREGKALEMHNTLISQVGQKIRILRGWRLRSMRTPKAGIRYDGLYKIDSWSLKLNMASEVYTLRLTLERLPRQRSMDEILLIPKPSQLDDWLLYEKLERERIRQTQGPVKLDNWTIARDVERLERDHWRRSRDFKAALREKEQEKDREKDKEKVRDEATGDHHLGWASWALEGGGGSSSALQRRLSDIDSILLPPPEVDEEEE